MYALLRPLLFSLPPETAHHLTLAGLRLAERSGLTRLLAPSPNVTEHPVRVMGLDFPNRVGLAAGLDKNGECIDGLAALGFGFIEIGTVTPRPQPGNPQPRLFRLPRARAIINRMGFNNHGVARLTELVGQARFKGILGINIGKNADTPIERASDDYLACLEQVWPLASYVTVNISSPNTRNLRDLQQGDALDHLLRTLKAAQQYLADRHGRYVPLAVKIAPDLDDEAICDVADRLRRHQMDGVIATNTTLSRRGVEHLRHGHETGGLSGAPVRAMSTSVISKLSRELKGELPIIGVGGIMDGGDATEKIAAGASLVQLYTGLVYQGPALVSACRTALSQV